MGKKTNTIEINGKRYDAATGAVLDVIAPAKQMAPSSVTPAMAPVAPTRPVKKPVQAAAPASSRPRSARHHDIKRKPAKKIAVHAPQHTKTLMRAAVSKPSGSFKRKVKAHGSTDSLLRQTSATIAPKRSIGALNPKRAAHAQKVVKSGAIKRFHPTPAAHPASKPSFQHRSQGHPIHVKTHHTHNTSQSVQKPDTTADLLERALQQATSHLQPAPKVSKKRRISKRVTSLAAVSAALVILGGFVALQSVPVLRLKAASSKAGFSANLPGYKPAGYHMSKLNAAPGEVSIHFASNSDDRGFAIVEKNSNWDSSTLRDSYLADSGEDYQAVQTAGRTFYVYGKNAATWVSGGVWYQIKTDGSLSTQQLIAMANSL